MFLMHISVTCTFLVSIAIKRHDYFGEEALLLTCNVASKVIDIQCTMARAHIQFKGSNSDYH